MTCPHCKTTAMIKGSHYLIRGEKLYLVQELMCRNPQCDHSGETIETIEHEIENVTVE